MSTPPIGTLMVIDDDKVDQMLYKRVVSRSGLVGRTESFYYAQEALDYLADADNPPVDLILLDINMPRMTGIEFVREATEIFGPRFAKMVVVMLTSSLNPKDKEAAVAFEAVKAFYNKPLTAAHLSKCADLLKND